MTEYRSLTADEVFFIFEEEHRLCSPLDIEADPSFDLQPASTIHEWRAARDLLPWQQLAKAYNAEFEIEVGLDVWEMAFEPGDKKTIKDVCDLIARHGKIEVVKPIKTLGQTCLSSALFKSIKKSLDARGIDTSGLSPSSKIEPYLKNSFGEFFGYINKNYAGVIPEINERKTTSGILAGSMSLICLLSLIGGLFWDKLLIVTFILILPTVVLWYLSDKQFKSKEGMLTIPGIVTFRDLINRILETKYASQ